MNERERTPKASPSRSPSASGEPSSRPSSERDTKEEASLRLHFAGVGGSGMSALAQFHTGRGGTATGSDRAFDQDRNPQIRIALEACGVRIVPQDGSGVTGDVDAVVVSTAVEDTVPDVAEARRKDVRLIHRAELLAEWVRAYRTIAITGTSGKSTVVAMLFEMLEALEMDPSVITGGNLIRLEERGLLGNAYVGSGDLLLIEADESDGSLVHYEPSIGVILNLQRDHKEPDELLTMFRTFASRTKERLLVGDAENLDAICSPNDVRTGFCEDAATTIGRLDLRADESMFEFGLRNGEELPASLLDVRLSVPGRHNVENAIVSLAVIHTLGLDVTRAAEALRGFRGVARRFQVLGKTAGIEVVDDFAHNPAKIAASLETARLRSRRILAIYQPHGFQPTAFIRKELVERLSELLGPDDRIWLPEIFYAGGTATRSISSADIVEDLRRAGVQAAFRKSREEIASEVVETAKIGDVVLVMGARDPSLTAFAKGILEALQAREMPAE